MTIHTLDTKLISFASEVDEQTIEQARDWVLDRLTELSDAGFGAAAAAPIARRVFDFVLLGNYPSEEDVAATRKGQSAAPIGTPRRATDVPLPGQGMAASAAMLAAAEPALPLRLAHKAAP